METERESLIELLLRTGQGREGNQVSARRVEEYVINRAMHLCNPRFSWREIVQEMAWPTSSHSETCFQVFLCIKT